VQLGLYPLGIVDLHTGCRDYRGVLRRCLHNEQPYFWVPGQLRCLTSTLVDMHIRLLRPSDPFESDELYRGDALAGNV
jgi:hypothetical protein